MLFINAYTRNLNLIKYKDSFIVEVVGMAFANWSEATVMVAMKAETEVGMEVVVIVGGNTILQEM